MTVRKHSKVNVGPTICPSDALIPYLFQQFKYLLWSFFDISPTVQSVSSSHHNQAFPLFTAIFSIILNTQEQRKGERANKVHACNRNWSTYLPIFFHKLDEEILKDDPTRPSFQVVQHVVNTVQTGNTSQSILSQTQKSVHMSRHEQLRAPFVAYTVKYWCGLHCLSVCKHWASMSMNPPRRGANSVPQCNIVSFTPLRVRIAEGKDCDFLMISVIHLNDAGLFRQWTENYDLWTWCQTQFDGRQFVAPCWIAFSIAITGRIVDTILVTPEHANQLTIIRHFCWLSSAIVESVVASASYRCSIQGPGLSDLPRLTPNLN